MGLVFQLWAFYCEKTNAKLIILQPICGAFCIKQAGPLAILDQTGILAWNTQEWSWSVSLCGHGCTIPFANPLRRMCDSMWFWGTVLEKIMTSMWYDVVCWFFPGSIDVKGLSFHTFSSLISFVCLDCAVSIFLSTLPGWGRPNSPQWGRLMVCLRELRIRNCG